MVFSVLTVKYIYIYIYILDCKTKAILGQYNCLKQLKLCDESAARFALSIFILIAGDFRFLVVA